MSDYPKFLICQRSEHNNANCEYCYDSIYGKIEIRQVTSDENAIEEAMNFKKVYKARNDNYYYFWLMGKEEMHEDDWCWDDDEATNLPENICEQIGILSASQRKLEKEQQDKIYQEMQKQISTKRDIAELQRLKEKYEPQKGEK